MTLNPFKLALLAIAVTMSGCSGHSIKQTDEILTTAQIKNKFDETQEAKTPAIRSVELSHDLIIDTPDPIPAAIFEKQISVSFSKEATLDDLAAVLGANGFYMIVPDAEMRKAHVSVFDFKGRFGDFLNALSVAHDLSFSWLPGNIISVTPDKPYILQIPQNDNIATSIAENITAMGAKEVKTSLQAGTIYYKANHRSQLAITEMINKMSINASVVSMQISIISVSLDRERNSGFDWANLKLGLGALSLDPNLAPPPATDTTTDTTITTSVAPAVIGTSMKDLQSFAGVTKDGLGLNLVKGDFSFKAAYNMLSTYGEATTTQSVVMDSLSGEDVKLKSGYKIPYIDSIGVNSSSGASNGGDTNSLGSTKVEEKEVGLDLRLTPYYDNRSKAVTINVALSLSSLIRFVELSAGNQLGTLSRPMIQNQEFTDLIKVMAGESVIIGGITYDKITDNRSNLTFLEDTKTASQAKVVSKTAMFIIMRPTVTIFEPKPKVAHE